MKNFIIKGDICYSIDLQQLYVKEDGYLVCENGISAGVYPLLPERYKNFHCYDYSGKLILPGLIDLHVHAPQYPFRGLGMDLELIEWLNTHAYREEENYEDEAYAEKAYDIFVSDLKNSATTRACIFGTVHVKATSLLMKKLEKAGIAAFVGKVNMDRNCPESLKEKSVSKAIQEMEQWIGEVQNLTRVKPILTPRFIPACSDNLMAALSVLQKKYSLGVQSHLSENLNEIEWVRQLHPEVSCYADAYLKYQMFGGDVPTVMAHCVYSSDEEIKLLKDRQVYIAHCPESNMNLSSGIAAARRYLKEGIKMGIGTDMAAGTSLSMFRAMASAIQVSKLRYRLVDSSYSPLKLSEVFYLGTKGGGSFFGNVGSFEKGYELDALVLDDTNMKGMRSLEIGERLERMLYMDDQTKLVAKFIAGKKLL